MQNVVNSISKHIAALQSEKTRLLIAIDGCCAAGKTTLALQLQGNFDCNIIHMDHFFLRPEQKSEQRLSRAGENIDHERFLEEVLLPLHRGEELSYRPYDCQKEQLGEPVFVPKKAINIIEGSYSCHPALWKYYDLRIFLKTSSEEQLRRILLREGEAKAEIFKSKWIPLEERYFAAYEIAERCDYLFLI